MINFILPAVVFLVISGLFIFFSYLWENKLSPRARAFKRRVKDLSDKRGSIRNDGLDLNQTSGYSSSKFNLFNKFLAIPLQGLLFRAGSKRTIEEFILGSLGLFILSLMGFAIINVPFIFSFLLSVMITSVPLLKLIRDKNIRSRKFEAQLVDAIDFMGRALMSGHGVNYSFYLIGEDFPEPLGAEFKIAAEQINYGLSLNDALNSMTDRVKSSDLNFFVTCLIMQRETGGNLAELLSTIANTIRERLKFKGRVRVLTSEGKLSAIILTSLPIFLGLAFSLINYSYMSLLWTTSLGIKMLAVGFTMIPLGILWMKKIVDIKV